MLLVMMMLSSDQSSLFSAVRECLLPADIQWIGDRPGFLRDIWVPSRVQP